MPNDLFKPTAEQAAVMKAVCAERDQALEKARILTLKIDAWNVLYGDGDMARSTTEDHHDASAQSLTRALEELVNNEEKPLTFSDAKDALRAQGFAENRLSTPFYIAIKRLKDKGRIAVSDNKMLSRVSP